MKEWTEEDINDGEYCKLTPPNATHEDDKITLWDGMKLCDISYLIQRAYYTGLEDGKKQENTSTIYKFRIPIGDWSGDGHSQVDYFNCVSNKPVEEVRKAWFNALALVPQHLQPEHVCEEYEDGSFNLELLNELKQHYSCFNQEIDQEDLEDQLFEYCPDTPEFAAMVIEFCMKGDPELKIEITPEHLNDMLPFYGHDSQGRHIGFIGYGLLGF